jgi:hypothetical protein
MTKDEWRLLGYGLLAASLMLLSFGPSFLGTRTFLDRWARQSLELSLSPYLHYPDIWEDDENPVDPGVRQ